MASKSLHTEGMINDYFLVESKILSTRSADAYKAIDKSRNETICLWLLKNSLPLESSSVRRFLARMYAIEHLSPPICNLQAYGIDAKGVPFAILNPLDGHPVDAGNVQIGEAERRYMACLRLLAKLHGEGILCGDLSGNSYLVNRVGDVEFVGLMGSFDSETNETTIAPPNEVLPFIAPEQKSGLGLDFSSDVFAIGVLGYFLFTGKFPFGEGAESLTSDYDISKLTPVSDLIDAPPFWVDEVISKCLNADPLQRYSNAQELIEAIAKIRERAHDKENAPVRSNRDPVLIKKLPKSSNTLLGKPMDRSKFSDTNLPVKEEEENKKKKSFRFKAIILLLIVGLIAALLLGPFSGYFIGSNATSEKSTDLSIHRSVVTDEGLKEAIDVMSEGESTADEKARQLENIVSSDDPIAHDILVKSAMGANSIESRRLSEKAIIDRARRLGLIRSAEQVRQWLRRIRVEELPKDYEPILQSLDVTLPKEAQEAALRRAYPAHAKFVLRLAAALALDSNNVENSQAILAQLIGDSMQLEDANTHSGLSLILAHPELSIIFGDDIIQRKDELPDKDLLWLLEMLAQRNDLNVRAVASLAVERGVLPKLRGIFIETIRDRGDLTPDILQSLIHAAAGVLAVDDISALGRWYDVIVPKLLLTICAENKDSTIVLEAFDTLAGRSVLIEPSASLISWIRSNYWDNRGELAQAVGILGNLEQLPDSAVEEAISAFDDFVKDSALIDVLLEIENPIVGHLVVEKYGDLIGVGGMLNLLDSPYKEVRMSAINSLKDYNDIGVLKIVIDYYEREKDPDVKKAYKDSFWVIKQRESRKMGTGR